MAKTPKYILIMVLLAASALAGGGTMKAPDGVPYGDKRCRRVMQKKPLSRNLLTNGSFEKGRYWPAGWEPIDRLGTFWVRGGTDGRRCMRIFTNVQDSQWSNWNKKVRRIIQETSRKTDGKPQSVPSNPLPQPPERKETSPPYYDTAAGLHGIHYRSRRVPVKPGAVYRISVDARTDAGGAEPIVFVKSFFKFQGVMRNAGRAPLHLYDCNKNWKRYARVFHPSEWTSTVKGKPVRPEKLEVQIYAYWPPGNYFFDNLQLHIVGHQEIPDRRKKQQNNASDGEKKKPKPKEEKKQLGEDEFPVFEP